VVVFSKASKPEDAMSAHIKATEHENSTEAVAMSMMQQAAKFLPIEMTKDEFQDLYVECLSALCRKPFSRQ
jgi:hypothetical protein